MNFDTTKQTNNSIRHDMNQEDQIKHGKIILVFTVILVAFFVLGVIGYFIGFKFLPFPANLTMYIGLTLAIRAICLNINNLSRYYFGLSTVVFYTVLSIGTCAYFIITFLNNPTTIYEKGNLSDNFTISIGLALFILGLTVEKYTGYKLKKKSSDVK